MRARSKSAKIALAAMAAAAMVGLAATHHAARGQSSKAAGETENILPVSTQTVSIRPAYTLQRTFTARIAVRRVTDLGFDQPGTVTEVLVDDGDPVTQGDILARLDTDRLVAERSRLKAQIAEARANLALARKTNARTETLVAKGHTSEQRLDETQAEVAALSATVARLRAAVRSVQVDLDKAGLTAPFDGTVQRRLVDEGAVVAAGTPVLQLLETGDMEAQAGVPLSFARRLKEGAAFDLSLPDGTPIPAKLKAVAPGVRGATRTVTATFTLDRQDPAMPFVADGELVVLSMRDRVRGPGFWVPLRALTADVRGLWRLYRLEPAGGDLYRIVFENVQIRHTEGDRAFVSGTVNDGVLVVKEGVARVAPGQLVRPVDTGQADS